VAYGLIHILQTTDNDDRKTTYRTILDQIVGQKLILKFWGHVTLAMFSL